MRTTFRISMFLLLLATASCYAQFTGAVQGTVQDSLGEVVPNAHVILINADTGVSRMAVSNESGVYRFVSLAPANYTVSTTVPGFSPVSVSFNLATNETRDVTLALTVAQAKSTITVTTEAPLIDTSDSRLQETLNTAEIADLPLPGRDPISILTITPGVTGAGASGQTNFAVENRVLAGANGQGQNGNMYVVDGLDVTSNIGPGVMNLTPNADVVQEISVQTNTYTVDYGRAGSIQTMITTKSGTNQFHGLASEYYVYQGLAARGEFGVKQPTPLAPYHTNNMSFAVGGPLIPHKEFFFFVGYEPYLSMASNGTGLVGYEDPAFLAFAQSALPSSPEVQLMAKYPVSGVVGAHLAATAGQLYGNSLSSPAAQQACAGGVGNVTAYDNITVPCSTPVLDQGNFNSSSYLNAKQYNIRIDKYFKNDRVYGQFFRATTNQGGPPLRPNLPTSNASFTFSLQANETHTFSPNTLNEAAFGYIRIEGKNYTTGNYVVPIVKINSANTPTWGTNGLQDYWQHNYHWRDVLTHIHGSHSFKAGAEDWLPDDVAWFQAQDDKPTFVFLNMIDLIANNPYSETGISYNPVTGAYQPGNRGYRANAIGIFAEDTWKAGRKLTINYGIRYDNFGNPHNAVTTNALANFHLASGASFASRVANGVMTQQSHVLNQDMNYNFSPRVGVAYDPFASGKWVVRGGFGLFHNEFTLGNAGNSTQGNPPGFVVPTFYNNGSTASPIFAYGTQNTYPYGFPAPAYVGHPLNAYGGVTGSQINVGGTDVNLSSPKTLNWSGGVERQLGSNLVASAAYTGSHSYSLVTGGGVPGNNYYGVDVNIFPGDLIQHPTYKSSGVWTGTGTQTRLNTSFGAIRYSFNGPRANYYAIITAVKGKLGAHGFLTASYAHSAAQDNWNSYPEGYVGGGGTSYNLDQWYSPSPLDVPNAFSLGWTYHIPGIEKGNGFTRRLTSGYSVASTTSLQAGNPFFVNNTNALSLIDTAGVTVTNANYQSELAAGHFAFASSSGNYAADGDNNNVPNVVSYSQKHDRKSYEYTGTVDSGIFTHAQFAQPAFQAAGTEGNEKLGRFWYPGYADTDLTVKKTTAISERLNLELRFDTFNLFNRVNLSSGAFDSNFGDTSANFGTTNSNLSPRNMQLGARLNF